MGVLGGCFNNAQGLQWSSVDSSGGVSSVGGQATIFGLQMSGKGDETLRIAETAVLASSMVLPM